MEFYSYFITRRLVIHNKGRPCGRRIKVTYEVIEIAPTDPLAKPLFDELQLEYSSRYGEFARHREPGTSEELTRYPPELFLPPDGIFLLLRRASDGAVVGGGAFKRYDAATAEFKRMWARSDLRRQGVARRIVAELEVRALRQGYRRAYLTTGFRQPEAVGLYLSTGFEPLYDRAIAVEIHGRLPFGKDLLEPGRTDTLADLRAPGPLGFPGAPKPAADVTNQ
jgi:GNAT superfamily N-acetyltransferase